MIQYLTAVFKAMYHAEPGTAEDLGCSPEELAEFTTSDAFEEADLDHNGNLSFEEFQKWQERTGEERRGKQRCRNFEGSGQCYCCNHSCRAPAPDQLEGIRIVRVAGTVLVGHGEGQHNHLRCIP
jgi:hypothetical protein